MDWFKIGSDNLDAAKMLSNKGHYRSACSRAYYSAYATLTAIFDKQGVDFSHGGNNPSHGQLESLVANNLPTNRLSRFIGGAVRRAFRELRRKRLEADYEPSALVGKVAARQALREASEIKIRTEGWI